MRWLAHGLVVAALLVAAPSAGACVLAGPLPTPDERVQAADVAFTGTVTTSVPQVAGGFAMTVQVDRVLKGRVPETVQLTSGMTSCSQALAAGTRTGFALSAATPVPWDLNVYDIVGAAAFDALPADAAFAPVRVTGVAAAPSRRRVQVHVKARACATLRPRLIASGGALTVAVAAADGPRCTAGARVDRCVTLTAARPLGGRALHPARAPRVATAERCAARAS